MGSRKVGIRTCHPSPRAWNRWLRLVAKKGVYFTVSRIPRWRTTPKATTPVSRRCHRARRAFRSSLGAAASAWSRPAWSRPIHNPRWWMDRVEKSR